MTKNKILVVEDYPDNSELLQKILEHLHFDVVLKTDGPSALEWCENNVPDIIFMDVSLPGIDGLEVTKELRGKASFQTVPIIALTAHVIKGFEKETLEAGCTEYISKPYTPTEIIELTKKYFNR